MKYQINNIDELDVWVENFTQNLKQKKQATIITLSGDLGAGKTTLTQLLAKKLYITETLTSPTFVIQKEYPTKNHLWIKKIIHIDAYRLEQKEDLEYLGWNDIIKNNSNLIIIEWPEMVKNINIPDPISLHMEINKDDSRNLYLN